MRYDDWYIDDQGIKRYRWADIIGTTLGILAWVLFFIPQAIFLIWLVVR